MREPDLRVSLGCASEIEVSQDKCQSEVLSSSVYEASTSMTATSLSDGDRRSSSPQRAWGALAAVCRSKTDSGSSAHTYIFSQRTALVREGEARADLNCRRISRSQTNLIADALVFPRHLFKREARLETSDSRSPHSGPSAPFACTSLWVLFGRPFDGPTTLRATFYRTDGHYSRGDGPRPVYD